jgi:hypothetical protein
MELVEVFYLARNIGPFIADAEKAAAATGAVGKESEAAGVRAGKGAKGLLGWAATGIALFGAASVITSATKATTGLATATLQLREQTGMDTQTASEWVALAKERGLQGNQLSVMFTRLSKAMETYRQGTVKENTVVAALNNQINQVAAQGGPRAAATIDRLSAAIVRAQDAGAKARKTFTDLGVPLADITKGNIEDTLLRVSDRLRTMRDPAERSALVLQLFGRSGQRLLPILMEGSQGIQGLLADMKRQGDYMSSQGVNNTLKFVAQQRAMSAAFEGAKLQIGQDLIPLLIQLADALTIVVKAIQPLLQHGEAFRLLLLGITAAFVAFKLAALAANIADLAFNATLDATPIGWIILALEALVIVTYEVYKHWTAIYNWFKSGGWQYLPALIVGPFWVAVVLIIKHWKAIQDAALDVWKWLQTVWPRVETFLRKPIDDVLAWLRKNWPLVLGILVGPFAGAAAELAKNFRLIEDAALGVIRAVEDAIKRLVRDLTSVPHMITHALKSIPGVGGVVSLGSHLLGAVGLQAGGTVQQAGAVLVGERGPELVYLPQAATVVPLSMHQAPAAGVAHGRGRTLVIEVPVTLDRQVVARAVAQVTADMMARR